MDSFVTTSHPRDTPIVVGSGDVRENAASVNTTHSAARKGTCFLQATGRTSREGGANISPQPLSLPQVSHHGQSFGGLCVIKGLVCHVYVCIGCGGGGGGGGGMHLARGGYMADFLG